MLNEEQTKKLKEAYDSLSVLNKELLEGEVVNHFLEIIENKEILLNGNTEGFIYIATVLLELATAKQPGKHFHFDENSIFDKCTNELIIAFKKPEWE